MWRAFGADMESGENKEPQRSYFRPRISSISGVLHSMTKQRFLTPPSTAIGEDPHLGSHHGHHPSSSVNPSSGYDYGFDSTRINGSCLTGAIAPSPSRSSYGDLNAYSRTPSTRASIDSAVLHGVYNVDHDGEHGTIEDDGRDSHGRCTDRARSYGRGFTLTIIISLTWVGTLHLLRICYELNKLEAEIPVPNQPNSSRDIKSDVHYSYTPSSDEVKPTTRPEPSTRYSFSAPFFMAWYCSMWNIFFLPVFIFCKVSCLSEEKTSAKKIFVESVHQFMEKGFTALQFFTRCGSFCVLWVFANYLLIHTLRKLDTTVVLSLFACTVSFVYLLSWVVLHQQFVGIRIVAAIISATGIALLAYMDGVNHRTLASVFLAAGAAAATAVYKVFYKRTLGYTSLAQTALFFTLVGFMNAFLMWPLVLLLYFTGAERLTWEQIPWLPLSGAALLNLTANLLGNFGIQWTYEVFLTLGLCVAIPISAVMDASFYRIKFEHMKLAGIILIMLGFLVVLLPDNWNQYLANILRSRLAKWKRNEQMKKNGSRVQDTTTAQLSRLRTPSGRVK